MSLLAACGEQGGVPAAVAGPKLAVSASPSTNEVLEGSIGPGALYKMVRPAN